MPHPVGGLTSQLLVAGIVINFAAFVATTHVFTVASAREIAPVLPFAAALAGRELGPYLGTTAVGGRRPGRAGVAALGLVLAGYLAGLGLELTGPAAPPQDAQLTAWLESHPIGAGLAGYWEANVVTLASGGRVAVRPVTITDGRVAPTGGEVRAEWFNPGLSLVDFVVLFPGISGYPGFSDQRAVLATFGKPGRVYRVGLYTILWWPKNLLSDMPSGDGAVCLVRRLRCGCARAALRRFLLLSRRLLDRATPSTGSPCLSPTPSTGFGLMSPTPSTAPIGVDGVADRSRLGSVGWATGFGAAGVRRRVAVGVGGVGDGWGVMEGAGGAAVR